MKKFLLNIFLPTILFCTQLSSKAQTTLTAGDVAFTGYIGNVGALTDQFSFVILKAVTTGTIIKFTDFGWRTGSSSFNSGAATESEITLTTVAMPAGTEIIFDGTAATRVGGGTAGTVVYSTGGSFITPITFASTGDQLFAYQGSFASPVFIAAMHMNVETFSTAATWDGTSATLNGQTSEKPVGLTTGVNSIWFTGEVDNAKFKCGPNVSTPALALAALNKSTNWDSTNVSTPTPFTLPAGCGFLGAVPVKLVDFSGKLNIDNTATLQWRVENQIDIKEYIVEKSLDGIGFTQISSIAAGYLSNNTFSFTDSKLAAGVSFYRLKISENSGKINYSNIVSVNVKTSTYISIFPNPVSTKLTIRQTGTLKNSTALILDAYGKVLHKINFVDNQQKTINTAAYPAGFYIVKMEDGTVYNFTIQK